MIDQDQYNDIPAAGSDRPQAPLQRLQILPGFSGHLQYPPPVQPIMDRYY
jgi:hypothetical protein